MKSILNLGIVLIATQGLTSNVYASCIGAGPQAPRDIDDPAGSNPMTFESVPYVEDIHVPLQHPLPSLCRA